MSRKDHIGSMGYCLCWVDLSLSWNCCHWSLERKVILAHYILRILHHFTLLVRRCYFLCVICLRVYLVVAVSFIHLREELHLCIFITDQINNSNQDRQQNMEVVFLFSSIRACNWMKLIVGSSWSGRPHLTFLIVLMFFCGKLYQYTVFLTKIESYIDENLSLML